MTERRETAREALEMAAEICDLEEQQYAKQHRGLYPEDCQTAEQGCYSCAAAIRALVAKLQQAAALRAQPSAREALEMAAKLIEPKGPCPRSPWIQGVGPDPHMETAVIVWNAHTAIAQRLRALAAELPEGEK